MHHLGNVFLSIYMECANSLSLSRSLSKHRKTFPHFHNSIASSRAAVAKAINMVYQKVTFLAILIVWFIPQSWLVAGVSSLLIGLIQSYALADWSTSKWWFSWFVLFQSSGVLCRLNHLTELIISPPEPGKLVQSKAWLVESVVLNRIKACSLCSTLQLFFALLASLDAPTLSDRSKWSCQVICQVLCQKKVILASRYMKICSLKVQVEGINLWP